MFSTILLPLFGKRVNGLVLLERERTTSVGTSRQHIHAVLCRADAKVCFDCPHLNSNYKAKRALPLVLAAVLNQDDSAMLSHAVLEQLFS